MYPLHEIDFFGSSEGLAVIVETGLTRAEVLEVQLALIATLAGSPLANTIAHMDPPEEFVKLATEESLGAQLVSAVFGQEVFAEESKNAVHQALHLFCALNTVVGNMTTERVLVKERAQINHDKLIAAVKKRANSLRRASVVDGNVH